MPRVPTYCLHKASGRAVVRYKPLFGKSPHYLPGAFNSDESLEAFKVVMAQVVEHMKSTAAPVPVVDRNTLNISRFTGMYLEWAKQNYSQSEYRSLKLVGRCLLDTEHKTRVNDFGPLAFKRVRERMVQLGWSRGYVNHQSIRLRRIFRWGVAEELVDPHVPLALEAVSALRVGHTPAPETKAREPVEWPTVQAVMPYVPPVIRTMLEVQHLSGMRSAELCAMRPCEIAKTDGVWIYSPARHKTAHLEKIKVICLGPKCQALLAPYEPSQPDGFYFSPAKAIAERKKARPPKQPRYGVRKRAKPRRTNPAYNSHEYAQAIKHGLVMAALKDSQDRSRPGKGDAALADWLAARGVAHFTPHQLRHARATIVTEEHGLEAAAAVIGDSLQAAQIYSRKLLNIARKIALESG